MREEMEIVYVVDEDSKDVWGVYDVSKMKGEMKGYYDGEGFSSYDEYEADMIERGAIQLEASSFTV